MTLSSKTNLKEAYALALAPAVGLFCVDRYEAGRFYYLQIPSELVDLPLPRLIAGGTALTLLALLFFVFVNSARNNLTAKSGFKRFFGAFFLFFPLFGLPLLFMAGTSSAVLWSLALPVVAAGVASNEPASKRYESKSGFELGPIFFLSLLLVWLLYSFGYFVERQTSNRLCFAGDKASFVANVYGDRAIIKRINPASHVLLPEVEIRDISSLPALTKCQFKLTPAPSFVDAAFSKRHTN